MATYATGIVRKFDNGYRAHFVNESERGLWKVGDELFNRALHEYPKGALLRVVMTISPAGRKMVKSVTRVKADSHEPDLKVGPAEVLKAVEDTGGDITGGLADMVREMAATVEGETVTAEALKVEIAPEPAAPVGSGYFVGPEERLVFNTVLGMSLVHPETAIKVMMVGPSGYGKTSLPRLFAQLAGKRYLRMNCATVRDPEEWFGYREAREGSTVFVRSEFAKALEAGNLVVVLDEFNRLEPWLHNTLFPLLDDDGCTVVHDETFRIGPGVIVVGTINSGYRYTGTFELDEALMNRFQFILEVGPMPFAEEVKVLTARTGIDSAVAHQAVKVAGILRSNEVVCSTRTTLLVANMVMAGLTLREAYETAVVKRIPADASGSALRKQVIDLVNVELGPVEERPLDVDIFNVAGTIAQEPVLRHEVTLFIADGSKTQMLKMIKLVQSLEVTGAKLSLNRASALVNKLISGETLVLEVAGKPANLDEFATVGITVRYSSMAA